MGLKQKNGEQGTVMIEGVFGVFVSIIVMALLLSFGFYIYQRTLLTIVANEIAEEVVMTYEFTTTKDNSKITIDKVRNLGHYRNLLFSNKIREENEKKGTDLANVRLSQTSLAQKTTTPTVTIEKVGDDVGRMHYEVTLSQRYEFLMGDLLALMGISSTDVISATVYVESMDISNYVNTVKFTNYGINKLGDTTEIIKMLNSIIGIVKSIYTLVS